MLVVGADEWIAAILSQRVRCSSSLYGYVTPLCISIRHINCVVFAILCLLHESTSRPSLVPTQVPPQKNVLAA